MEFRSVLIQDHAKSYNLMFDKLVADDVPDDHEFSKFYKLIRLANDDVYTYLKDDLDIKLKYDAA